MTLVFLKRSSSRPCHHVIVSEITAASWKQSLQRVPFSLIMWWTTLDYINLYTYTYTQVWGFVQRLCYSPYLRKSFVFGHLCPRLIVYSLHRILNYQDEALACKSDQSVSYWTLVRTHLPRIPLVIWSSHLSWPLSHWPCLLHTHFTVTG